MLAARGRRWRNCDSRCSVLEQVEVYCPSPDFASRCADCRADTRGHFNFLSQLGITNNRCAPSCQGHKRKVGGTSKNSRSRHSAPPHLQIASDAIAYDISAYLLYWRFILVTLALPRVVSGIFNVEKCDLEIPVSGHSKSSKVVPLPFEVWFPISVL